MLPAPANAIFADRSAAETPGEVLDAFVSHLARTGRGNRYCRRTRSRSTSRDGKRVMAGRLSV